MKEQVIKTIQLFRAAALQQMNEKKKNEQNEKIINTGEKPIENIKIKI